METALEGGSRIEVRELVTFYLRGREVKAVVKAVAVGLRGCGIVASGLYLCGWRFGVMDTLAGKGVIDVGKYIFLFVMYKLSIRKKEGV